MIGLLLGLTNAQTITTLSDARGNFTFVPYTAEQRVQVSKNVESLLSVS